MKKRSWITLAVIVAVIILAIFLINASKDGVSKKTTMCIANNSEFYTQLGCHACEIQKDMFGKNSQYLTIVDCWFEKEKCFQEIAEAGRFHTPTWVINGEKYIGVQSIEKLKNLTSCN